MLEVAGVVAALDPTAFLQPGWLAVGPQKMSSAWPSLFAGFGSFWVVTALHWPGVLSTSRNLAVDLNQYPAGVASSGPLLWRVSVAYAIRSAAPRGALM